MRILHELKTRERGVFLTLTLDDKHLAEHDYDIAKPVLQKFTKRVRYRFGELAYYGVGEYGDTRGRPHYHMCVLGQDFKEDRKFWRRTKKGHVLMRSEELEKCWKFGHVEIGELNFDTAAYTARYVMKKVKGKKAPSYYEYRDVRGRLVKEFTPEFALMSSRIECEGSTPGGLGKRFFLRYWPELVRLDSCMIEGKLCPLPRYYDKLLERLDSERFERLKEERVKRAEVHAENNTRPRLRTRARVLELRERDFLKREY